MKIVKLKCPSCGASLENDREIIYCAYCGVKLLLDDEAQNINYKYTKVDEARIKENERKEKIRLKELENEEKEKVREHKTLISVGILMFVLLLMPTSFMFKVEEPKENEIRIPSSSEEYIGINYEQVIQELKNAGFTDIEAVAQNDLVTGWLTKDGSIDRISIDGDTDFRRGEIISKDAIIVITYRTFETKENKN